jgi:transketolase
MNSQKRCQYFRQKILDMSLNVSALHIGGSFSCTEILDTIFFRFFKKKDDLKNFILSKGHCSILHYVILNYLGIVKDKDLKLYSKSSGKYGVHPEIKNPGINASTGSLGHGLAIGAGFALSNRKKTFFVVLSDGELQEGSTWEAVITISALKLNNLIIIIDNNDYQSLEKTSNSHPDLYPLDKKFRDFGWDSVNCNGHNVGEIYKCVKNRNKKKPFCLIAKTIKGYPISFMKDQPIWHYRSPNKQEYLKAKLELEKKIEK